MATVEAPGGADGEAAAVTVEPLGGQPAGADTVSVYSAADGDLAGADATSCIPPAHEHWLTGAATTVGTTAVLVLSNPSASASTVDLSLYGAEGPVEAAGTAGIVLAPGQTRSLVLGGLAPGAATALGATVEGPEEDIQHRRQHIEQERVARDARRDLGGAHQFGQRRDRARRDQLGQPVAPGQHVPRLQRHQRAISVIISPHHILQFSEGKQALTQGPAVIRRRRGRGGEADQDRRNDDACCRAEQRATAGGSGCADASLGS